MSKEVDLSSKEWCDLIFEGKNKEFGAYTLRRTSVARHNKALVSTVIGLAAVGFLAFGYMKVSELIEENRLKDQTEQTTTSFEFAQDEESSEEETEQIKQEEKQPEPEIEEIAQQAVTELKIVPDDKVTTPPPTNEEVLTNDAAISTKTVEGALGSLTAELPKEAPKPIAVVENKVQVEQKPVEDHRVFESVEQMPQFPGGDAALLKYISSHMQYPAMAAEQGIEGRVTLQFVVTKNGSVGEVKVVRPLSPECDNEAKRVVRSLPKFTPGRQNGQAVNVWYTLPVTFKLQK